MSVIKKPSILVVAAEASSALYAQRLLEFWKKNNKQVKAYGIGNEAMVCLGFEALGRSEELAVMGIQEVLQHYSAISKAFKALLKRCDEAKPQVALLLDYPGFNFTIG